MPHFSTVSHVCPQVTEILNNHRYPNTDGTVYMETSGIPENVMSAHVLSLAHDSENPLWKNKRLIY